MYKTIAFENIILLSIHVFLKYVVYRRPLDVLVAKSAWIFTNLACSAGRWTQQSWSNICLEESLFGFSSKYFSLCTNFLFLYFNDLTLDWNLFSLALDFQKDFGVWDANIDFNGGIDVAICCALDVPGRSNRTVWCCCTQELVCCCMVEVGGSSVLELEACSKKNKESFIINKNFQYIIENNALLYQGDKIYCNI